MAGLKQRISISQFALEVLEEDRNRILIKNRKLSHDAFLNRVILSALEYGSGLELTTVDTIFAKLWDNYTGYLSSKEKDLNSDTNKKHFLKAFSQVISEHLGEDQTTHRSKRISSSFNLYDELHERLNDRKYPVIHCIIGSPKDPRNSDKSWNWGEYVNMILEAYAHLPYAARVRIVCFDVYKSIKKAIEATKPHEKVIKIKHRNSDSYYFVPYELSTDQLGVYPYVSGTVIGVQKVAAARRREDFPYSCSFRLERINGVEMVPEKSSVLDEAKLVEAIHTYKVEYLAAKENEKFTAIFHLTSNGVEIMNSVLENRPNNIELISGSDNNYKCTATRQQLIFFLTRLGPDVRVLEPESLKKDIIQYYQNSLKVYSEET